MMSARGIRNACGRSNASSHLFMRRSTCCDRSLKRHQYPLASPARTAPTFGLKSRPFSSTRCLRDDQMPPEASDANEPSIIEQVVRDAKQRFRDTLPKGYLNEEEYALYVRLYGPPLRETEPEDVGIPTHADMGVPQPRPANEGTILKEVESGEFEEITYEIPTNEDLVRQFEEELEQDVQEDDPELTEEELAEEEVEYIEEPVDYAEQPLTEGRPMEVMEDQPSYVEAVARNPREADAMQQLAKDFENAQKEQQEKEEKEAAEEEGRVQPDGEETEEALSWPKEWEEGNPYEDPQPEDGYFERFHPYTLEGSFHGNSLEIALPAEDLTHPIADMLRRTHVDHVREAAEKAFGGAGLPLSSETVRGVRNGNMGGVGLLATQRHMTEIDADAFMAAFMPGVYASSFAILREVRKRMGSDWIQSKLKDGKGLSVLDVGSGGAGLIAWEQILNAEWQLLKESGEVTGETPPGQKTVIASSDRLRNRVKNFLQDTTFLPRLPDYEHSGEMRGPRLDGGGQEQNRKSYDLIIASHQFLKDTESHRRQAVLNNLWQLLKKDGGTLIIQEKAHPRGFEAVAHARHTILNSFLLPQSGESQIKPEDFNATYHRELEPGHVIAPCTTQGTCPMYPHPGKSTGRKDYCHFSQRFVRPQFNTKMLRLHKDNRGEVEFSYVAVQRGVAKPTEKTGKELTDMAAEGYAESDVKPDMQTLPRIILPALKRKGHVTVDVCTPESKIERWTVSKKMGKTAYHDARKSRWGDLWALGTMSRAHRNLRLGQTKEISKRTESSRKKARNAIRELEEAEGIAPKGKKGQRSKLQKKQQEVAEMARAEEEEIDEIGDEIEEEVNKELEEEEEKEMKNRG